VSPRGHRAEAFQGAITSETFSAALRRLRQERRMSLRRLSKLTFYDFGYLGQIERGERTGSAEVAARCDVALQAGGLLADLFTHEESSRTRALVPAQRTAAHSQDIDLIAQTEAASETDLDGITIPCRAADGRIIWVTVPRRTFLLGGIAATIGMTAAPLMKLGSPVGINSGDVSPVEHLKLMRRVFIDSDNLLGPGHIIPAVQDYIRVIQRLRSGQEGADKRALLHLQAEFAEFASWLHQDSGDFRQAQFWLDRALEWTHAVNDRDMAVYVMARKSQLSGDMRDPASAIDLANAAATMAVNRSRLQATARTYEAHGHALAHEGATCLRTLDEARALVSELDDGQESAWATWLDGAYIDVQRARCLSALGKHDQAATVFQQAIQDLPPGYRRDRGVYLAREALAHAGAHDPEQAATDGLRALAIAEETGSGRIIYELVKLDSELIRWANMPEVADFRESLTCFIPREARSISAPRILPATKETT
jgi:tetratricopeptide (TPR) repeat protein/transcriptional regulator with XRE-family HTH domain